LGIGDALTLGGGVFVLLFSFLPFVSYSDTIKGPIERSGYDTWFNAWEIQTFMAPITWFAVLSAVGVGVVTVTHFFLGDHLRVLTLSGPQLQIALALFSFLVMLGYALSTKSVIFGSDYAQYLGDKTFAHGVSFSVGGYLMMIFAGLSVIGALLNLYRIGPTLLPRSRSVPPVPENSALR
jgi:hypothetical protein